MRTILASTAMALALLVAGPSWAADSDQSGTTGMMTTTPRDASDDAVGTRGTQMGTEPATGPTAGTTTGDTAQNEMVGKTLYGANGEEVGEIERVAADGSAVVGVGGFLGIGQRSVSIPRDQIQMEGDRLTTSMTKDQISALPAQEG